MLKEAMDEVIHGGGAGFELASVRSAILEGDLGSLQAAVIGHIYETAVADGDTEDVRSQVLEGGLSIADRFAVDDPILLPNYLGYMSKEGCFSQAVKELGPEQLGKGFDRQEEVVMCWQPTLSV